MGRFGKSKTYHKKAIYKFLKKKTAKSAAKPACTRAASRNWPLQGERLPPATCEPALCCGHFDLDRPLRREGSREDRRRLLPPRAQGEEGSCQEGGRHLRGQERILQGFGRAEAGPGRR